MENERGKIAISGQHIFIGSCIWKGEEKGK